jgi:hypothetical protein
MKIYQDLVNSLRSRQWLKYFVWNNKNFLLFSPLLCKIKIFYRFEYFNKVWNILCPCFYV